jgi:rod shape-determining protein MreB
MFGKLLGKFSKDLGMDLGTGNVRVYVKGRGVIINEPSVVAINNKTDQILALGLEAQNMLGKTPPFITTSQPLHHGIISDFEVAQKMIRYFIEKAHEHSFNFVPRPRVIVGVPLEITEVERKAVEDAVLFAGAREVFLVESPMLAAIGARINIEESVGNMVVSIGAGTTEIAVISLAGVVTWKSIKVAGDEMNRAIVQYARDNFNLILGERAAENIKIAVGSASKLEEPLQYEMRGRDLISGLPKEIIVNDSEIREALNKNTRIIIESIKSVLEVTPPELIADIYERGIILTGGSALLKGMDKAIAEAVEIPVTVATDPLTCVVRGAGLLLENDTLLKTVALPSTRETERI